MKFLAFEKTADVYQPLCQFAQSQTGKYTANWAISRARNCLIALTDIWFIITFHTFTGELISFCYPGSTQNVVMPVVVPVKMYR